ncbi:MULTISPECIES: alpha/beta hydrolase [unclassified Anabaena]|uniref:alpha/beta hydrolase n=1 Tax=unclassified Anabaena TaxID=2619674 RepID=UPI0014481A64|nr:MULTISPECIES: alpha/beta hydrolase [unclassified Anabaena]MTJ07372.1 alpha/beta hydrolase [Anabaena sp. UHCC 0204]MTJ55080.1 alpha/beta hydrolase [Anabaena sp. UHCC 0253]
MDKQHLQKLLIGDLTWKRMLKSLLFIYAFFAVYVYFRADSMIFLPQPSSYQDNQDILKLKNTDNKNISAIYLPNNQAKYTILYAHGNAEDLGYIKPHLEKIRNLGFSVFAYDYRGYGTSEGTPTEKTAYQDIDTAYNYLTQTLKIPPQQIIVFGRSVGGGSAVDLASRKPVGGLIVESSFTSIFRVVVPVPLLPFDKFTNRAKIKKVNSPVLIIHGKNDEIIPFTHGEKLFAAVSSPKLSFWVEKASHNDLSFVAGEKYGEMLKKFADLVEKNHRRGKPPVVAPNNG